MDRKQIIQAIFDNCADNIENDDFFGILRYIYFKMPYSDRETALSVYAELISNMCSLSDILNLEYKLPLGIWLICAAKSNIADITIDMDRLNEDVERAFSHAIPFNKALPFSRVTITLGGGKAPAFSNIPHISTSVLICNVTNFPDYSSPNIMNKFEGANAQGTFYYSAASPKKILFVPTGFTKVTLDPDMKNMPERVFAAEGRITSLILPETDGIQLSRWITNFSDNVIIYKKKGQKISCYKNQTEWVKNHLQSI